MTELKYMFTQYTEDGETLTKVTTTVPYRFFKSACEAFCSCHSYDATTKMAVIRVPENLTKKLDALWAADQNKYWAHRPVQGQVAMSLTAAPVAKAPVAVSVKSATAPTADMVSYTKGHDTVSKVAYIGTKNGMRYKVSVRVFDKQGNIVTLVQWFNKDQVEDAAELCKDIDDLFEDRDIDFVQSSEWNHEKNGTIMVLPF